MLVRCAVSLLSCLLLGSCSPFGATYREIEVTGYPRGAIWNQVIEFARSRGYRADREETDVGRRIYTSLWVGQSVAFRRSRRQRFHAKVVPIDADLKQWLVRFYIEVQTVENVSKNMRPEDDDWDYAYQDGRGETEFREVLKIAFPRLGSEGDGPVDGDAATGR